MSALVLIDGSNVARCSAWRRHVGHDASDHDLRRRLVDATCGWAASLGLRVQVTFDGVGPWKPGVVEASPEVQVIGTGGEEGDDVIARLAREVRRAGGQHWLVSSDRELRLVAGAGAVREITADDFVLELLAPAVIDASQEAAPRVARPSQLRDSIDQDTRTKLERMRRGLDPE